MPKLTTRRAMAWLGIAGLVWFAYASGIWAIVVFLLVPLAFLAAVPRLGPWLLEHLGWRRLPRVGRLSGFAATLAILGIALAIGVSGNTLSPLPSPSARPDATAAASTTGTGAPSSSGVIAAAPTSPSPSPSRASAPGGGALGGAACVGKDARANVYHPDRLVLLDPCRTVTGTVQLTRREGDGDWHVQLQLDAGQEALLNAKNVSGEAGALVLEIICANTVTQADAVTACASYTNTVPVPAVGARISATGPFVLDTAHGWNEIHPVWSISVIAGSSPTTAPTIAPTAEPTPAVTVAPPPPTAAPTTAPALSVTIATSRYGLVAATTLAGASCTAKARLPSGNYSSAQGLAVTKTADGSGAVSWTYGTSSTTTPGTGTHTVICTLSGATATASAPFTVP